MRTRMAPKKYHPEFVCRMVCAVHTSKPQFILIQSSHLIWCWNCVVLLWVLAAFFTHRSIESIVPTVNFVALNRDFIMHFVCVCCPCPRCVCVCVCVAVCASTTRLIFTKMDSFQCRERTQTLSWTRASAVYVFCSSIPIIVGRHNKRFLRRWNGTLWTLCARTEPNRT